MSMSTIVESPVNRVIRRYAITPGTVQGRKVANDVVVSLRYTEDEALFLHRESKAAVNEALDFARRRGMLPKGIEAEAVCVLESLRRA